MANDSHTVRRTVQFKFTLPTANSDQLVSLLKSTAPFYEAFGARRMRLLQNVDDPARFVHEIAIFSQKSREKDQQAQEQSQIKQENCERARTALRTLESGQRISSVDKEGERYHLDEQQIAAETQRARESVQKNCS